MSPAKVAIYERLKREFPPEKFSWSESGMSDMFDVLAGVAPERACALAADMLRADHGAVGTEVVDRPGRVRGGAERVGGAAREGGRQGGGAAARVGEAAAELSRPDAAGDRARRGAAKPPATRRPPTRRSPRRPRRRRPRRCSPRSPRPAGTLGKTPERDRRGSLAAARGGGEAGAARSRCPIIRIARTSRSPTIAARSCSSTSGIRRAARAAASSRRCSACSTSTRTAGSRSCR